MYAVEHARCLAAGVLLPRWYPDLNGGLGGPEPRPRPLLPLYLGGVLAWVLGDAVAAMGALTVAVPVVAGGAAFLSFRRLGAAPVAAATAAAVWAASPYLVVSLHHRVALQECLALAFLPWMFGQLLPPGPRDGRAVLSGALATACLLATQLLVAFMALAVVGLGHLLDRRRQVIQAGHAVCFGIALAAVSWLPNLASLGRLRSGSFVQGWFDWRRRFLFTGEDAASPFGRTMAWVFVGVSVAALLLVLLRDTRGHAVAALVCACLATPAARPLWEAVPGVAFIQFPWRWLGVASCLAVVGAAVAGRRHLGGFALASVLLPLLAVQTPGDRLPPGPPLAPAASGSALAEAATRFGVLPILPSFPAALPRQADPFQALQAMARPAPVSLVAEVRGPARWRWVATAPAAGLVSLPLLAADVWAVRVDGRLVGWRAEESLVAVMVPPGRHVVEARQVWLPEDVAGAGVSLAAWMLLLLLAHRLRAAGRARGSPRAGATPR